MEMVLMLAALVNDDVQNPGVWVTLPLYERALLFDVAVKMASKIQQLERFDKNTKRNAGLDFSGKNAVVPPYKIKKRGNLRGRATVHICGT